MWSDKNIDAHLFNENRQGIDEEIKVWLEAGDP